MLLSPQRSSLLRTLAIAVAGLCLPLLWPGVLQNLFSTEHLTPDQHEALWPAALVILHVGSDLLIWLSYTVIAGVLGYIVYRNRTALPFDWVVLAFGLFIVACGFTHLMHVLVRYTPVFWLDGYVRGLTAVVSITTAAALPPLIPRLSEIIQADLRSREHQAQLEQANTALAAAVTRAEFLSALSDALQTADDPREVAELALAQLGPVLGAEQIIATQIAGGRARLWRSWGQVHPAALDLLSGEGTPLERTGMMRRAVETGQVQYTRDYARNPDALTVAGADMSVAIEPIKGPRGQVGRHPELHAGSGAVLATRRTRTRPARGGHHQPGPRPHPQRPGPARERSPAERGDAARAPR